MLFFTGCTPETRLLNKIPVNSVEVQALDKNDQPLNGAQVEASNGRKTTTDGEGIPKGTYTADLYTFGVAPEISLNIWSTNPGKLPGGVLKYETTSDDGELMYKSELNDYGNDAGTKLDSF